MTSLYEQLRGIPRSQLETSIERTQELAAAAFKAKDFKQAYDYYNTVLAGTEFLEQEYNASNGDVTALCNALSNRSACSLARKDPSAAFRDAQKIVSMRPKWQKAWYRFGRALYDLGKVLEAEAAFAEGIQLDISNQEMLRWRALSRDRIEELRVEQMKKRRFSTDYSKFAGVLAEAEIPDDEENGSARVTTGGSDAPVLDTLEEMHDLMGKKQQAQLDAQTPTDIYFRNDMVFLPQAESPPELQQEGAFAAMAVYLEQTTSLYMPKRAHAALHQPAQKIYARAIRHVATNMERMGMSGHFLHIGVGTGVPLLVSASLPESVVTSVTALTAHGSPFLDSMAHHLLHRNGMPDRVTLIRKPVEHVMMRGAGDAEERRPGAEASTLANPALVLILDPDLMDEGLLGLRLLPYVRHARRALCIPTPLVVPSRARVFAVPVALHTPKCCGLDIRAEMDEYRWGPWYEDYDLRGCVQADVDGVHLLAEPVEVFCFDFGAFDMDEALPVADKTKLEFVMNRDAELNAIAFWWTLDMVADFDETISNAPAALGGDGPALKKLSAKHSGTQWNQALQWVDSVRVKKGATVKVDASHNSTRIRFNVTSPERLTPIVHRHAISRWHFEMVADVVRNEAFEQGVVAAIKSIRERKLAFAATTLALQGKSVKSQMLAGEQDIAPIDVVDFGTGTGLLALMAARAGATTVTGFDNQGHIVNVARKVVRRHGFQKQIKIIRKDCRQLVMGKDLQRRADLLVMELFDYGFLGEGCLHFVHFAWNNCLAEDGAIMPRGGKVFAMLVQLDPEEVEGFDVRPWGTYRFQPDYFGLDLRNTEHVRLSESFEVFGFDFNRKDNMHRPPEAGGEWAAEIPIIRDGRANAVVFWCDIDIWEGIVLTTHPDAPRTCWFQACQPIEELRVTQGSNLPLKATHQGSRITFGVDRELLSESYDELRTDVPLFDPLWLQIHNRLIEQGGKLEKTMSFNASARQQATDALISISVDPARFGRSGRYIEGSRACQFAWSFFMG